MYLLFYLLAPGALCSVLPVEFNSAAQHGICRFSPTFTLDNILQNSTDYEANIFYWDGQFHKDGVGYQQSNGMTIDRVELGYATGLPNSPPLFTSNPKNEAYHIMLLAHAIAGNPQAQAFVASENPGSAGQLAAAILSTKLATYTAFNIAHPGYGGLLPPFQGNATTIWPTQEWFTKVPAAENGQLIWAVYAMINVLQQSGLPAYKDLAQSWSDWFVCARTNVHNIFNGPQFGQYCAVATLRATVNPNSSLQKYACEHNNYLLNDPYEGELMSWFIYFSGTINATEGNALWEQKRLQLQAVNYTGSIVDTLSTQQGPSDYTGKPVEGRNIVPITTQKGLYFGSNEQAKLLYLPYVDNADVAKVFKNAERVRTCNSVLMGSTPGMFAEVTNVTYPSLIASTSYIRDAGIPSAAVFQEQELGVVTPYSVFPTILFDRAAGLAWYKTMLDGRCMQTIYGNAAATRRDGVAVSALVSWESKAPTLLALLGGVTDFVRQGLKIDGVYDEFISVMAGEYGRIFDPALNGGAPFMGEKVQICLPNAQVPTQDLIDFSSCNSNPSLFTRSGMVYPGR